jgi:hypothetical protein
MVTWIALPLDHHCQQCCTGFEVALMQKFEVSTPLAIFPSIEMVQQAHILHTWCKNKTNCIVGKNKPTCYKQNNLRLYIQLLSHYQMISNSRHLVSRLWLEHREGAAQKNQMEIQARILCRLLILWCEIVYPFGSVSVLKSSNHPSAHFFCELLYY